MNKFINEDKLENSKKIVLNSGLFDHSWYDQYGKFKGRAEAVEHYLTQGADLNYMPVPDFDGQFYLLMYPEVSAAGINPLVHFISYGEAQLRMPNPYLDLNAYKAKQGLPEQGVLKHYIASGRPEGPWSREPSLFTIEASNQGRVRVRPCSRSKQRELLKITVSDQDVATLWSDPDINAGELEVWAPPAFRNGETQLVTCTKVVSGKLAGATLTVFDAIQTPLQYLKGSEMMPQMARLSGRAADRYENLQLRLANLSSLDELKNIQTNHQTLLEGYRGRKAFPAFSLPKVDKPRVSIVVPAYNSFELTYHCITSISFASTIVSYEVILADDCSTDITAEAESIIGNLVVSRPKENSRFLRNCNLATQKAKGEFVVFLNNDTEVLSGWLDELVEVLDNDPSIGLVGSKLLNRDGSIQEAGGVVWGNGQPWNAGRDKIRLDPEFNYLRDVDYVTGAAMCLRKDLWETVGRFSDEFAPCYYEDTDLAFKVRAAGYRTCYVPTSEVVHFEGQSHGTDVTKGLKQYQLINESAFRRKWYSDYKGNGEASFESLHLNKDRHIERRVIMFDNEVPQLGRDAGSYAAIQELKLLQSLGYKVTFVPLNFAHLGKHTRRLQKMGVEVLYAPNYFDLDELLDKRLKEMDLVYITRFGVAEQVLDKIRSRSQVKVLFNNADLHFLREIRGAVAEGSESAAMERALKIRERELAICRNVDAVLCYSKAEHAVLESHLCDTSNLQLTPWVLDTQPKPESFESRKGITFLGGFGHTPNVEAVDFIVKDVMPQLEKIRPDIKLYVYGSNMPEVFDDYNCENVEMVGYAKELADVYQQHRIFVAPLLSGAGIKGKVLDAISYRTPCILTDVAAEGTGLVDRVNAVIANSVDEWVAGIIELYDSKEAWESYSAGSKVLHEHRYSHEHGRKQMKNILESVGIFAG
ncbi:glycosyltransferase [uncultured Umboniibacter sp.]|uniref:glycosyltransferase n=1 Tax=uncultured Umboniibacter sp. TaxID=1798917 RepID=UPI002603E030|nr:glycosyltransferase [uncultured Umboniibacter sp.]